MIEQSVKPVAVETRPGLRDFLTRHGGMVFFYLSPLAIFMVVEILQYGGEESTAMHPNQLAFWVNMLFYYGVYSLVRAVTGKTQLTLILLNLVFLFCGGVNYYSIAIRNEPVVPWDIFAARTAGEAVSGFTWWPIPAQVLCCSIGVVVWMVLSFFLHYDRRMGIRRRLEIFAASVVLLVSFTLVTVFAQGYFYISAWRQVTASHYNGMALNFCINIGALFNEEPSGYSPDTAESILAETENESIETAVSEKKPNLIVIMDETFADLSSLGDLELTSTKDVMPFVRSLSEDDNAITGNLVVPAFGGGTCNTEYEFLTSNSYAFFKSGSYPMLQYVTSETPSIASVLKEQGYSTTAIHPYYDTGWARNRAYPLMGFDTFLSMDDFTEEEAEILRRYISDRASFNKIIQTYENKSDEPMFVFNVTIQNHCGYDTVYDNFPETVEFKGDYVYPYTKQYLSLIQESDNAVKELVNYFRKADEPTMIVFFGDHMPYVENSFYNKIIGSTDLSEAELELKKHSVPFFIWANYDIDGYNAGTISCNYLGPLTLETAGLEMSDYEAYVYGLRKKYPVISAVGCLDPNDIFVPLEMAAQDLHDYKIVQYQTVFDKKTLNRKESGSGSGSATGSGSGSAP